MIFVYILLAIFTISVTLYTIFYYKAPVKLRFAHKVVNSAMFVTMAVYALHYIGMNNYSIFIAGGALFGFFGDIFLGLRGIFVSKKKHLFIVGITLFFLGHCLYLVGFLINYQLPWFVFLLMGLVFTAVVFLLNMKNKVNLDTLAIICYFYAFICSLILSLSICNAITSPNLGFILLAFGTVCFGLSDTILCYLYFGNVKRKHLMKYINIVTYFIGQMIIALSVILIYTI